MPVQQKTIVVMRHAKAEQAGPTDFERELAPRGVADAREAGAWLAAAGVVPDAGLVSAAARTQQTWEALAAGGSWDLEGTYDRGLYDAGPDTALDLVRGLDEAVASVVMVGHNPTMAYLATILDDGEGDPGASAQLATGYPTCALTVFTYDGAWTDLETARLTAYFVGRA